MEEDKGTVCVTGGTGYLASWLIKRLLDHGYSVHTTIRPDPGKASLIVAWTVNIHYEPYIAC